MAIFGGRSQTTSTPSAVDIARVVSGSSDAVRAEADIVARSSDTAIRNRFAQTMPRTVVIPADHSRRLDMVQSAIVAQDREDVADLSRRADVIGRLPQADLQRVFGVRDLPSAPDARMEATLDLASRDVQGFESPAVAARRALDKAREVRSALKLVRSDADGFRDVSPLARLVWKHVPDLASRFGIRTRADEGYSAADAERGDVGLSMHNSGADARAASRMRAGFSQAIGRDMDVLVGPQGAGGMVDRLVDHSREREHRVGRPDPVRNVARDMSAAAFLSGLGRR